MKTHLQMTKKIAVIGSMAFFTAAMAQNTGIYDAYVVTNTNNSGLTWTQAGNFNGADLGILNRNESLIFSGGQNKVYKCNGGDVTAGNVYYAVYPAGQRPANISFTKLPMNWVSNDSGAGQGCQNQTWQTTAGTANIAGGLKAGKYNVEVYFDAPGYPSTAYYSNNSSNFTASFTISANLPANSTSWNGTSWTNGIPDITKTVYIDGDYAGSGFYAKDLIVASGTSLIIDGSTNLQTLGAVTNNGRIVVQDQANFIQFPGSSYSGSGEFVARKSAKTVAGKYAFWSSPVQVQDMYGFFGEKPQYVMTYNSNTDYYDIVPESRRSDAGVGYSVKTPADQPLAEFVGAPNNGEITVTLDNNGSDNPNGNTYNLIGNPYPSALDLNLLYDSGKNGIASSFYFWDNKSATNVEQTGPGAITWVSYNAFNQTWSGPYENYGVTSEIGAVKKAQGFIVKATGNAVTFTNGMRTTNQGAFFNKHAKAAAIPGKYWIGLIGPTYPNGYNTAIVYGFGSNNGQDEGDTPLLSVGEDQIYSIAYGTKLAIQGRAEFVDTDIVNLGYKTSGGNFSLKLTDTYGFFTETGQAIYLVDNLTKSYTNLRQQPVYNFTTEAGDIEDRFTVVYRVDNLSTPEVSVDGLKVYKDGESIVVSAKEKITKIQAYDMSGKLVKDLSPNSTKANVDLQVKGIYILKIEYGNKTATKKILK